MVFCAIFNSYAGSFVACRKCSPHIVVLECVVEVYHSFGVRCCDVLAILRTLVGAGLRQLYAQLLWEINQGERYWPSREEEEALIAHNNDYRPVSGLHEMLAAVIEKPVAPDDGRWVTLGEISQMLKNRFGSYKEDTGTFRKLGVALNRPDYRYDNRHTKTGVVYFVRQKTE